MKETEENIKLIDELSNYNPSFKPLFSSRVLNKLEQHKNKKTHTAYKDFNRIFKWIALSGAAAIIALLISVYIVDGSLNYDALTGVFYYTPDEPAIYSFNL